MSPQGPRVAVITPVHGRRQHLALQVESLRRGVRRPDAHVLVAMADPGLAWEYDGVVQVSGDPQRLPLAAARNRGAEHALALGAEVLVFLDVDCLAGPDLVASYAEAAATRPGTVWSGPVTYLDPPGSQGYDLDHLVELDAPHPARPAPQPGETLIGGDPDLFWSLSFATSAATWRSVGGFHEGYSGYGAEDTDFGQSVLASGHELAWLGSSRAYHQYHPTQSPPVQHLEDIVRNGRVFRDRWGRWPMSGWLDAFEGLGLVERVGDDYARTDLTARPSSARPGGGPG